MRRHASAPPEVSAPPSDTRSWLERVTVGAALLALGVVIVAAAALFRVKSLAEYDGWAMWGMKSRAIAALGAADPDVFASAAYARLHLEYPLLLPSLHALPLQLRDGFSGNVVVLSCFAIGLAGLAAVWGILRERVRASILLPFMAALATAPGFFGQLATGYADVPVAMFVAAGVVASARWLLDDRRAWLLLTTLFVASAALTKNEGLLCGAATFVALFVAAEGRRRPVAISAAVAALVYAPWTRVRRHPRRRCSGLRALLVVQPSMGAGDGSIARPWPPTDCCGELQRGISSASCSSLAQSRSPVPWSLDHAGSASSPAVSVCCPSRASRGSTSLRRTTSTTSCRATAIG